MVLAVAAGIVIYAYVMGYLGGFGGTNSLGSLSIDSASVSGTTVTAYVRNTGKVGVTVEFAYVTLDGVTTKITPTGTLTIGQGVVAGVTVDAAGASYVAGSGKTLTVKLICKDNTQVSFDVK